MLRRPASVEGSPLGYSTLARSSLSSAATRKRSKIGVHGPKDLTLDEVAALVAAALGKPVKFVEVTLEQAHIGLKGATGMPDAVADIYMEAFIAWPEGRMDVAEPRTPETTTPTGLAEFLREVFLPVIKRLP